MSDYFARIGRVLEALVSVSTINGDVKSDALALCAELKSAPDNLTAAVEERVRAATETLAGQVSVLEQGRERVDAIVFSNAGRGVLLGDAGPSDEAEQARLRELFNGADPAKFDHDGVGGPLPAPPAPVIDFPTGAAIDEMTVAELKVELGARDIPIPAKAAKADLQNLLAGVPDGTKTAEEVVESPGASTETAPVS